MVSTTQLCDVACASASDMRLSLTLELLSCFTGKLQVAGILQQQRNVLTAAGARTHLKEATFSKLSRKRPHTPSTATFTAAAADEAYTPLPAATPGALVPTDAATAQPRERFLANTAQQQQALSKAAAAAVAEAKATAGKQSAVASVTPATRRPLQHRVTFATDSPTVVKTSKSSYDLVHDYSILKTLLEAKLQQCEQGSAAFKTVLSDIEKVNCELARLQPANSYTCTDATAVGVDESVACTPAPEPWSRAVSSSSNSSSVYSSARAPVLHAVRSETAGADVALDKHLYRRNAPSTDMKVRFNLDEDVCSSAGTVQQLQLDRAAASSNKHNISSSLKAVVEQSSNTSSSSSSSSSSSGDSAPATPPRSTRPVQNTAPRNHHILQYNSQLTPAATSSVQKVGSVSSSVGSSRSSSSSSFDRLCNKITTGSRRSAVLVQHEQQQQHCEDVVVADKQQCVDDDGDVVVMPPPCGFGDWAVIASAINVNSTSTSTACTTIDSTVSTAGVNNLASLFSAAATSTASAVAVAPQQQQQQHVAAAVSDTVTGSTGSSDAAAIDDKKAVYTSAQWKGSVEMSDSPAALACALFTRRRRSSSSSSSSSSELRYCSTAATQRGVRSSSNSSSDDKTAKDMPEEQQWWVRSDELLHSSSSSVGVDDSTEQDAELTSSSSGSGSSSDCEDRGQCVAHLLSIVDSELGAAVVQQLVTPEQSPTKYANTANFWAKSAVKTAAASAVKAAVNTTSAYCVDVDDCDKVDGTTSSSTSTGTDSAIRQVVQQQEQASSVLAAGNRSINNTAAVAVRALAAVPVMRQLSSLFNAEHSTAATADNVLVLSSDSTFDFSEANKENIPPHAVMVNKKQQQCKKALHLTAALQFQRCNENTTAVTGAAAAATTASRRGVLGVTQQQQQQQLSVRQALAGCAKAANSR
jgi:trimeric autotransporter adhesin